MEGKIELKDLPFEIQKMLLNKLDDKDYVSMYLVSKSWRFMISRYLRAVFNVYQYKSCVSFKHASKNRKP